MRPAEAPAAIVDKMQSYEERKTGSLPPPPTPRGGGVGFGALSVPFCLESYNEIKGQSCALHAFRCYMVLPLADAKKNLQWG